MIAPDYWYRVCRGEAVLAKGDDCPLKRIGKYATDAAAKAACEAHFRKACLMADAAQRARPALHFI